MEFFYKLIVFSDRFRKKWEVERIVDELKLTLGSNSNRRKRAQKQLHWYNQQLKKDEQKNRKKNWKKTKKYLQSMN